MSSENNNNWLGFSLSGSSMEGSSANHHHQPCSNAVSDTVSLSFSSGFTNPGIYYGVEGENGGFYSNLTMMPMRFDGSLCLMEAMNRSQVHVQPQGIVNSSTPKLEDFFGFESCDRGMALSLDSVYNYENQTNNGQDFVTTNKIIQEFPNYPSFRAQEMYQETVPKEDHHCNSFQLPTLAADYEMKNWVSRNYHNGHDVEQKMVEDKMGISVEESCSFGHGGLKSLSLYTSPGSQSSCVTGSQQIAAPVMAECMVGLENKKRGSEKVDQNNKQIVYRKSIDTFGQRTSQYRGVTRHRWTGRYEAHLWDNSCKKEGQSRKGRQVYLGGYDMEDKAARAYDLAALNYWGPATHINFPLENYQQELEDMKNMSRQEYVAHLRRNSSGFSRGASIYRGVTRHHQHGRWQARIGRVAGNKDLYLGTFSTQEAAAEAYDVAAIKFRGVNAVTNFVVSRYDVERIMESKSLLSGESARRNNIANAFSDTSLTNCDTNTQTNAPKESSDMASDWTMALYQSAYQKPDHGEFNASHFSVPLNGLVSLGSSQQEVDERGKMVSHLSNASSLVTSLGSSREGSSDENNVVQMQHGVSQMGSRFYPGGAGSGAVSPWIQSEQIRPQVPLFSAWTDAS